MRFGCGLLILGIVLLIAGGQGIREAFAFRKPIDITCDQFMKSPPQEGWYRITGCIVPLPDAAYEVYKSRYKENTDESASITKAFIPVRTPAMLVAESDKEPPTSLLLQTEDSAIIATLNEMKQLNSAKSEEIDKWMDKNENRWLLHNEIHGMIQTGINMDSKTREEIAKLDKSMTPNFVILEEGKTPSMGFSVAMVVGGIVAGIFGLLILLSRFFGKN